MSRSLFCIEVSGQMTSFESEEWMSKVSVKVRMYRQGLGDCFLLTFTEGEKNCHLLIDCGVIQGTENAGEKMTEVAESIGEITNNRIDVVAVTHEHWDHVSGFTQAKEIFDEMEFGEVWAGWTENLSDPLAAELQNRHALKMQALQAAIEQMQSSRLVPLKEAIISLLDFSGGEEMLAAGGNTTNKAWRYVLEKGDNKYFYPETVASLPNIKGVRVYILGPPHDEKSLKKMTAPKTETYHLADGFSLEDAFFAAVLQASPHSPYSASADASCPFNAKFRVSVDSAKTDGFFKQNYGFAKNDRKDWRKIDEDWLTVAGELALYLDSYTNNTCLALAIELVESGKVLIFPGDAQFGNWRSWSPLVFQVKENGDRLTVTTKELFERTVFYKVGHHGSHNATMSESGLEMMKSPYLAAMIPVNREMAKKKNWKMPFEPLFTRLIEKTKGRVLLADENDLSKIEPDYTAKLTAKEKTAFEDSVNINPLFVEYTISD